MASADTVLAMKALAADPAKQSFLLKDKTCIGGLVMVLSNPDTNIVLTSLETLLMLAEKIENRATLRNFIGMTDQLELLYTSLTIDEDVRDLAERLYKLLTLTDLLTPLKDKCNTSTQATRSSRKSSSSKNKSVSGRSSKHIVLQIKGMVDKYDRELIMKLVLQVRGVISITFDLNKRRCIIRTKHEVKPETLVQSIAKSMTMTAQQVMKDDNGEEIFLSFGGNQHDVDKENTTLPDYLPEKMESPTPDSKSLARTSQKEKNKGSGWLSTAASFLTNSFYW